MRVEFEFDSISDLIVVAQVIKALEDWSRVYRLPDAQAVQDAMDNAIATVTTLRSLASKFEATVTECQDWLDSNTILTGGSVF